MYKRYDGFYASNTQKKFDKSIEKCPLCGGNPHWSLELQGKGFMDSSVSCMCEKCGAKLLAESGELDFGENVRVLDVGNANVYGLRQGATYHLKDLLLLTSTVAHTPAPSTVDSVFDTPPTSQSSVVSNTEAKSPAAAIAPVDASTEPKRAMSKKKWAAILGTCAIVLVMVLVIVLCVHSCSSHEVSYENYQKIHNGMTYSEVVDILGKGTLESEVSSGGSTTKMYSWTNLSGTKVITVYFINGIVYMKTQVGLE